jgi:hypothetical protein
MVRLLLDTGSSTLVVASTDCGAPCTSVLGAAQPWNTSLGSRTSLVVQGSYGVGNNGWNASVYTVGRTSIGPFAVSNMSVAALSSQFNNSVLLSASDNVCTWGSPGVANVGIIGFGPPAMEVPGTTDWLALALSQAGLPPVFSLAQCGSGGTLVLGDAPADAVYVTATPGSYYGVPWLSLAVAGHAAEAVSMPTIVDSGTNQNLVPPAVFDRVVAQLRTHPDFVWRSVGECFAVDATVAELNVRLPALVFQLQGADLTVPAVGAYLSVVGAESGANLVCMTLAPTPLQVSILGWPFMSAFTVSFNLRGRVGFSPQREPECAGGWVVRRGGVSSPPYDASLVAGLVAGGGALFLAAVWLAFTFGRRTGAKY